jgi:hypothetical protein
MAKKRTATQEAEEEAKRKRHGWNKKKKRKVLNKEELLKGKVKKFDPRGSGYDQENAPPRRPANPSAGKEGIPHQGTRNPSTGQILKGQKHPTFREGMEGEEEAGYTIHRDELTGRLFSRARRNPSASATMVSKKELLEETATQEAEEEAKRKRQKTDYNKKKKR